MINTILFDLDGTLLPMEGDQFLKDYFDALASHFGDVYDPELLKGTVWSGTKAMLKNSSELTNEQVFWNQAEQSMKISYESAIDSFTEFYSTSFGQARGATWTNAFAAPVVAELKKRGYTLVIASNPVFPPVATHRRMRWAGLNPDDFELITTYDIFHSCKPNPMYYEEILRVLGKRPEECVMVGNDNQEDMMAEPLGIRSYLVTDCLINRDDAPISCHWNGTFEAFSELVAQGAL